MACPKTGRRRRAGCLSTVLQLQDGAAAEEANARRQPLQIRACPIESAPRHELRPTQIRKQPLQLVGECKFRPTAPLARDPSRSGAQARMRFPDSQRGTVPPTGSELRSCWLVNPIMTACTSFKSIDSAYPSHRLDLAAKAAMPGLSVPANGSTRAQRNQRRAAIQRSSRRVGTVMALPCNSPYGRQRARPGHDRLNRFLALMAQVYVRRSRSPGYGSPRPATRRYGGSPTGRFEHEADHRS